MNQHDIVSRLNVEFPIVPILKNPFGNKPLFENETVPFEPVIEDTARERTADVLDSAQLNNTIRYMDEQRVGLEQFPFLARTKVVDATDEEILPFVQGRIYAADIIADDEEAVVYKSGGYELVTSSIPNLKIGQSVGEQMRERLKLYRSGVLRGNNHRRFFHNYRNQLAASLLNGVRQRMEIMICGMLSGTFSYDRLGIKTEINNWKIPAELNVVCATSWKHEKYAEPVSAIKIVKQNGARYGVDYDILTLSTHAFRHMIASKEFIKEAGRNISRFDRAKQIKIAERVLKMKIDIYDATFRTRNSDGTTTVQRILPYNKIILTSSKLDNDRAASDWADSTVTESIVNDVQRNPCGTVGYFTTEARDFTDIYDMKKAHKEAEEELRKLKAWAIRRGWPRRHNKALSAVITAW